MFIHFLQLFRIQLLKGEPKDKDSFDHLAYEFITNVDEGASYQSDVQFETASPHIVLVCV